MADDAFFSRRDMLKTSASGTAIAAAASWAIAPSPTLGAENDSNTTGVKKGRIKQSVCRWCYDAVPLPDLAAAASKMGLVGIDLLGPDDFPVVKQHGLICTMTTSHKLTDGLCDPAYHEASLEALRKAILATAAEGWRNVICFSGNRRGIDDETGLQNCAKALEQIVPLAAEHNVTIQMELLNSRVNHPDYMCDRTEWGVELVERVGSDHFKLLYDIYHMQIMEGDVIRTIQKHHKVLGHYHTAGNPGRHELDDSQELNYRGIVAAIIETGFDGYLAQEFLPQRDPLASLAEAVTLCDV